MKLICLRHAESEYNLRGLCNADPGVPVALTERGRDQARQAAERLRDRPIQRLYVSRLQRAQETAAIVNTRHCAQLHVDARLDDRRSGFEGLPVETYLQAMQAAPAPFDWAAPGGESYRQLVARSQAFLADLRGSGLETVLVVTHHEVLQALIGHCRGLDLASRWRLPVEYAQMFEFELD